MKIRTIYTCDYCGEEFGTYEEARDHEATHYFPIDVEPYEDTGWKNLAGKDKILGYAPEYVEVKLENDMAVVYSYKCLLKEEPECESDK